MEDRNQLRLATILRDHGAPTDIIELVSIGSDPGIDDARPRGRITIGYIDAAGVRRETAVLSTNDSEEMWRILGNREEIGGLLALGMRAIPPARRPLIPAWITDNAKAKRTVNALRRARCLADDAAAGRAPPRRDDSDLLGYSPSIKDLRNKE